jgi:hypothetical protein
MEPVSHRFVKCSYDGGKTLHKIIIKLILVMKY